MAVCPHGHDSARHDFCHVCGPLIGGNPDPDEGRSAGRHHLPKPGAAVNGPPSAAPFPPSAAPFPPSAPVRAPFEPLGPARAPEPVPEPVRAPSAPQPPRSPSAPPTRPIPAFTSVTWTALVASDRDYYKKMKAIRDRDRSSVEFPADGAERRVRPAGPQMRIGRRDAARDLEPEIDLAAPARPRDQPPARAPDRQAGRHLGRPRPGLGQRDAPQRPRDRHRGHVPLREGDRINLGAWTAITVHRGLGRRTARPLV